MNADQRVQERDREDNIGVKVHNLKWKSLGWQRKKNNNNKCTYKISGIDCLRSCYMRFDEIFIVISFYLWIKWMSFALNEM